MKRLLSILIFLVMYSCQNTDDQGVLYNHILNYRDELKMNVRSKEIYISEKSQRSEYFKKRFDSLNRINIELDKSFENLRYGDRTSLIKLRNNFNLKYKLHMDFQTIGGYKNIPDTVFNKLIEIDFLRLKQKFQDDYMMNFGHRIE